MLESDLYIALEKYLSQKGYQVKGEVCGCDLVALKGEELMIVELKKAFNVKLLYQAARRLSITENVYVAVPKPSAKQRVSFWQMLKSLSRRLEIGLIVIDASDVRIFVEPKPFKGVRSSKKRKTLLAEFNGREASSNLGGVTRTKLQTAYLENAIKISVLLKKHKELSAKNLVAYGCSKATHRTLYNNHYAWFEKKGRGIYALKRGKAKQIEKQYPKIWAHYSKAASAKK